MIPELPNRFEEGELLLFNKPLYWTSFDLVNKVRIIIKHTFGIRKIKVGHAGTLDPLADGLMIICTGRATKRLEEFRNLDKEYLAGIRLGETTSSHDLETEINNRFPVDHITEEMVRAALSNFAGTQKQIPPIHSAKFIDGKRAYEFARKGVHKELAPVDVIFREVELIKFTLPEVKVRILCSKGTYIRSFVRDFGLNLNSGAHLSELTRTKIGPYRLDDAWTVENFEKNIKELKQI